MWFVLIWIYRKKSNPSTHQLNLEKIFTINLSGRLSGFHSHYINQRHCTIFKTFSGKRLRYKSHNLHIANTCSASNRIHEIHLKPGTSRPVIITSKTELNFIKVFNASCFSLDLSLSLCCVQPSSHSLIFIRYQKPWWAVRLAGLWPPLQLFTLNSLLAVFKKFALVVSFAFIWKRKKIKKSVCVLFRKWIYDCVCPTQLYWNTKVI